jgi:CBS domain containing-hemolysin-like protein
MQQEIPENLSIRGARLAGALALWLVPGLAHASFLSGDALDTVANWLAWFIIIVMPIVAIAVFLVIHVLPEKIAEKRHHPHKDSIKTLCILSLFFGGMLWPFAWIWAYTRPIGFRAIYGTEKHEDYYLEMGEKAREGRLSAEELASLRHELEVMASHAPLMIELQRVLDDVRRIEAGESVPVRTAPVPAPASQAGRVRSEAAHGD